MIKATHTGAAVIALGVFMIVGTRNRRKKHAE